MILCDHIFYLLLKAESLYFQVMKQQDWIFRKWWHSTKSYRLACCKYCFVTVMSRDWNQHPFGCKRKKNKVSSSKKIQFIEKNDE